MKTCYKCKAQKENSEFVKNISKKDGLSCYCKECKRIIDNEDYKSSKKRREQISTTRNVQIIKNKKIILEAKKKGCVLCPEKEFVALDFHHMDALNKDFEIAKMLSFSSKKLKAELSKCKVLCANCHRKLHAGILHL
jgi:hypothetical protein